ncbi:hypothetical protein [Actinomadura rugatobispora]|uniref:Uncharacterized protein n=1 Tax=Actinomadura rugatobispora TaxID=1994 RepID=A0ABW0ZTE1_9ACTN|nr:hypothetical protein GCM10010200_050970 [Actinomadura rugatobispora]
MLADASPVGDTTLLIVGPLVIALALAFWLGLTAYAARKRARIDRMRGASAHRGVVQGGVIEGDPSQRSRRDEAPRSGD